jgi:hypothetical protein
MSLDRRLRETLQAGGSTSPAGRLFADTYLDPAFTRLADLSRLPSLREDWSRPGPDGASLQRRHERDDQNRIRRISYPNGGHADIGRDASGQVTSITITRNGQRRAFLRDGNHWMLEAGPTRAQLPGQVQFNERNGDISYQVTSDGRRWRTEQSDGMIVNERRNAMNARVALNDSGQVRRITRADGSSVEAFYTGGELTRVTETGANGRSHVWSRQDNGDWTSEGQPTRRNMVLEANGNTRYESPADGLTHIIRGNGVELVQGQGRARYTFDGQGRITSLHLANGTGIRAIGYEGDTNYVNRISINDRSAGGTRNYARRGHETNWIVTDHAGRQINTAYGDARIGDDGSYMIRDTRHDRPGQPRGSHVWRSFGWNGVERRVREDNTPITTDRSTPHHVSDRTTPHRVNDRAPSRSIPEAHDRLLHAMREARLDAPRLARMNAMMQAFEERMQDHVTMRQAGRVQSPAEIEESTRQTVMRTYDNLAAMVSDRSPNTFYNQATRRFLAEDFMLHAAQPCMMNQGRSTPTDRTGHGTCWEKVGQTWAMAHHPDAMANLLRQVALRGDYTPPHGATTGSPPGRIQFSRNLLAFNGNMQETGWTLSAANNNDFRSPVGRIFDYTLPALIGRHGNIDLGNNGEICQIMYMVTGDRPSELTNDSHSGTLRGHRSEAVALLDHGAVLRPAPNHWMSRHLQRMEINGSRRWVVIDDNQWGQGSDRIIGIIDNLNDFRERGWDAMRPLNPQPQPQYRRFAVANDTGIGPTTPGNPPPNPYRPQPYRPQPYRPQPYRPQPYYPQPYFSQPVVPPWNCHT